MPCDYKKYPVGWKLLRDTVIWKAGNACDLCGGKNGGKQWKTGSTIVLTVHHVNFNVSDNRPYNLLALCQRCHNKLDMPFRVDNRRNNVRVLRTKFGKLRVINHPLFEKRKQ